jgi:hypothetical protein
VKEGEINHDTGENVKKDVRDVIPQRVKFPEVEVYGITQNTNRLIGSPFHIGKYILDISQAETSNLRIPIDHGIVPVGKQVV